MHSRRDSIDQVHHSCPLARPEHTNTHCLSLSCFASLCLASFCFALRFLDVRCCRLSRFDLLRFPSLHQAFVFCFFLPPFDSLRLVLPCFASLLLALLCFTMFCFALQWRCCALRGLASLCFVLTCVALFRARFALVCVASLCLTSRCFALIRVAMLCFSGFAMVYVTLLRFAFIRSDLR